MRKKVVSILLLAAMAAGTLTGCGGSGASGQADGASASAQTDGAAASGEEGKVINIYCWNDEFQRRVDAVYPEKGLWKSFLCVLRLHVCNVPSRSGIDIPIFFRRHACKVFEQLYKMALG